MTAGRTLQITPEKDSVVGGDETILMGMNFRSATEREFIPIRIPTAFTGSNFTVIRRNLTVIVPSNYGIGPTIKLANVGSYLNSFIIEAKIEEELSGALPQLLVYLSSPSPIPSTATAR